jgi:cytochrome c biogenesis protein CcmG, thiol:disulfide interchange protein DsbE
MRGFLAIVAGLVLGVIAGGLLLGGILAFAPEPVTAPTAAPSVAVVLPTATPTAAPSPSSAPPTSAEASPSGGGGAGLHVGEPAPALSVPQVGGGTIDLGSLKGQPVWVTFVTTDCQACKDAFPTMNRYADRYAPNGLVVLAIDVREDEGKVAAFAESVGATFSFGLDADGTAATAWGAGTRPVHFWIDKDGVIRDAAAGPVSADAMKAALEKIMPGVPIAS